VAECGGCVWWLSVMAVWCLCVAVYGCVWLCAGCGVAVCECVRLCGGWVVDVCGGCV
jgi:hypothetical protein